ncbi:DinB/UmuC family translesion DNA polymerase [Streptomyces sp. NPDC054794]
MNVETPQVGQPSVMHVRCPDRLPEETYRQVLELLADLSPVVQALPPSAALVQLKGALRYHGVDGRRLGEVLRVRAISRLGVDVRVGIGPTITVAATASGQINRSGRGPRDCARARRRLARPAARALPASATVRHTFDRHTLDGAAVRAALLDLVVQLGVLLRNRDQAARALTLTLRFAGGTSWEKTRRLREASAHDEDLRSLAYQLMDAAGLQRGRLTGLALKGEDLIDAGQVAEQISLDQAREARLVAEAAIDRIRAKFGPPRSAPPRPSPTRHDPTVRPGKAKRCCLIRRGRAPYCRTGPTRKPSTKPSPRAASRRARSGPAQWAVSTARRCT